MNNNENIFGYYRERIEQCYLICAIFLGLAGLFLFDISSTEHQNLITENLFKTLPTFCILVSVFLLMDYTKLMTILDHRFPDSLQRLDDFILNKTKKKIDLKKTWLASLIGIVVFIGIFSILGKGISSIIFIIELIIITFLTAKLQSWMHGQNKKMFDDIKHKLETEFN